MCSAQTDEFHSRLNNILNVMEDTASTDPMTSPVAAKSDDVATATHLMTSPVTDLTAPQAVFAVPLYNVHFPELYASSADDS